MVTVTALIPLIAAPLPFDTVGDLLVVVYVLLLGTFFLALAGLDPGTAFGGMGASREVTVAAIAEPTIALAIFGLALGAGSTGELTLASYESTAPLPDDRARMRSLAVRHGFDPEAIAQRQNVSV
jgi:formate hydrogenlyase subunit 4